MITLKENYNRLLTSANFSKIGKSEGTNLTSKIVDLILSEAILARASDIHLEPIKNHLRIRFRIDGKLYDVLEIIDNPEITVMSRIKILSNIPTDAMTARTAMDGRFSFKCNNQEFDFRIATFPTILGEKIAIRILNKDPSIFDMKKLGLNANDLSRLEQIIQRKSGLFIVSGPTGSGKTTTLYAILNHLHTPHVNIVTLEDPVEYQINGINQCDIKKGSADSFASGLKGILRQDPNVILIGEIRDIETAEIAIRASITGHLVMSSLHSNSALGTAMRLINMGLERYMVSYAMIGAVAQRLVPRLCPKCRIPQTVDPVVLSRICKRFGLPLENSHAADSSTSSTDIQIQIVKDKPKESIFYKNKIGGCDSCNGTGYNGREGIYEIVIFNEKLREAILSNAPMQTLEALAAEKGYHPLAVEAFQKVKEGLVTFDDIYPILLEKS